MEGEYKVVESAIVEGTGVNPSDIHPTIAKFVNFIDAGDFKQEVQEFCSKFCDEFSEVQEEEEHPLRAHDIFQRYEQMFEKLISEFLEDEKMSVEDFFLLCKRVQSDSVETSMAVQMALSSLDYSEFCKLMKRQNDLANEAIAAAEDMGF
mmetsp:Transcript_2346/g.3291  ORF Transcript_2346/g.3291 Transcript_2346/m.3291 type:complete len:150 (+) Transcript_2346:156-605(+)|eukprot:CAMPEP_0117763974 /NCGR_PEP_ID=MMETSP0947-20121206/19065_1 /TAXON_ID=44440 /ORGANISM="Chattonella subsalsa, Strain CCMP2191" /LENGTH=149 /DNA_ID=CAMNT_0005585999 /DNA_START=131 /DNA_END=580 /DNA_ORIENTATION=-